MKKALCLREVEKINLRNQLKKLPTHVLFVHTNSLSQASFPSSNSNTGMLSYQSGGLGHHPVQFISQISFQAAEPPLVISGLSHRLRALQPVAFLTEL